MKDVQKSVIGSVAEAIGAQDDLRIHHQGDLEKEVPGRFVSAESLDLPSELKEEVDSRYPDGLFRHQHLSIESILAGQHTVVSTTTSSGKSLIHLLPILKRLIEDPKATVLLVYPQKALANDQLLKIRDLASKIPSLREEMRRNEYLISRFDGATDKEIRNDIKENARVVLTNPEMLHLSILQYHSPRWSRLLENLSHVVIDECHEYRGIFGTNVSYIFRRLRQLCSDCSSSPLFIATSATVNNPGVHLENLTGVEFQEIGPEEDGSVRGRKKLWILSGEQHVYDEARKLGVNLAREGLSTLVFSQSRVAAERMLASLRKKGGELPAYVRVYRAGLSAEEREDIERGLRAGDVRLVFTTSALELGIDIGALDAVICAGFPASQMSLLQRAGRVGRQGREGAFILIPASIPIDSYYAANPKELLERESEGLSLHLENNRVLYQQYACAKKEAGGDSADLDFEIFGESMERVHKDRESGKIDDSVFYLNDPHMQVNIRGGGGQPYKIVCGNSQIGDIGEFHLLREAYRNAVYLHGGRRYRVREVFQNDRKVICVKEFSGKRTTAIISTNILRKRLGVIKSYPNLCLATAAIDVTQLIVNVVETDRGGKKTNEWKGTSGMPACTMPTEGIWIELRSKIWSALCSRLGHQVAAAALDSCVRLLRSLFPVKAGLCDSQDYSVTSEVCKDGTAGIYLYDQVYDGVGLTTDCFDQMEELLSLCLSHLNACCCKGDEGCLSCIANPVEDDARTSKRATGRIIEEVIKEISLNDPNVDGDPSALRGTIVPQTLECPACDGQVMLSSKFCSNCGERMAS